MLNGLITTLDNMIALQKKLIEIADRKKQLLIERNIDELNQLRKEESELVKQMGQLENMRLQQVEDVTQGNSDVSFRTFVDKLEDQPLKGKLLLQLSTLQELLAELHLKNKVNEQILKDSLHFVQHMIDQVTQSKQQHFNYQSPLQQKSQTSSQGFFDTKA